MVGWTGLFGSVDRLQCLLSSSSRSRFVVVVVGVGAVGVVVVVVVVVVVLVVVVLVVLVSVSPPELWCSVLCLSLRLSCDVLFCVCFST